MDGEQPARAAVNGDGESVPAPVVTYSLEEVAAMIFPPEMSNGVIWLQKRIRAGQVSAYKVARTWRMTHEDVEDFIERNRNTLQKPVTPRLVAPLADDEKPPSGMSPGSLRYHQRYPEGNPNMRTPKQRKPSQ